MRLKYGLLCVATCQFASATLDLRGLSMIFHVFSAWPAGLHRGGLLSLP